MATSEFKRALATTRELEIAVTGRKSGRKISAPVWFVHEGDTLYLLPVRGSDSHWYKNVLRTPSMTISAGWTKITAPPRPITDVSTVREVAEKFRGKYGVEEIKKYYSKLDVCVAISLDS